MTREELIALAKEAGGPDLVILADGAEMEWKDLERFAALVAAKEREECADMPVGDGLSNTLRVYRVKPQRGECVDDKRGRVVVEDGDGAI